MRPSPEAAENHTGESSHRGTGLPGGTRAVRSKPHPNLFDDRFCGTVRQVSRLRTDSERVEGLRRQLAVGGQLA